MKQSISLRVRFAETDAMGVVYHSRYFEYLEMARVALMDSMGLPYVSLADSGWHLPVLEVHGKYIRPARFDDKLTVEVCLSSFNGLRMKLDYTIKKEDQTIFEGSTLHAFVNNDGRPCRPPEEVAQKFKSAVTPCEAKK
jgi:acyl-CoA thioester hydrolase